MASFFNQQINLTYPAVIKTEDNAAINSVPKPLTDGDGNLLPVSVGTLSMVYTGIQDFTGATVTGAGDVSSIIAGSGIAVDTSTGDVTVSSTGVNSIIAGSGIAVDTSTGDVTVSSTSTAGLIAGTGANSMRSADALTTTAPQAPEDGSIALGNNARALAPGSIAIGNNALILDASRINSVCIGSDTVTAQNSVAIGDNVDTASASAVGIGHNNIVFSNHGVVIGNDSSANNYQDNQIVIGKNNQSFALKTIMIGSDLTNSDVNRPQAILVGNNVRAAQRAIVIGNDCVNFAAQNCIQIGNDHVRTTGNESINIGSANDVGVTGAVDQIVLGRANVSDLVGAAIVGNGLTAVAASTLHCNSLNINVVTEHADNAAAIAAGLPVGQVYRTGDLLKVRH